MVLKKLKIFGFKSFADKTEVSFGDGMTAIVGPNGCGKSNIMEAIRWVFGEQKSSALRSGSMQDVIFSGSQKRQALNVAEVTLVIENSKGLLPVQYSEVSITRRLYRNGDSEYMINNNMCRLKDIQNLFLDTGVGSAGYTIIENSMISRILSSKPEDRRVLFEEAAGIGKFKKRIRETERKLEKTSQDLLRINDRVKEKEKMVRMLQRQVEKARKYTRYKEDLKSLELGFENRRYRILADSIASRGKEVESLKGELAELTASKSTYENQLEKLNVDKVEKENLVTEASKQVGQANERIASLEKEISVSSESVKMLGENIEKYKAELGSIEEETGEKRALIERIENGIKERSKDLEENDEKAAEAKQELEDFENQVSSHKSYVDEISEEHMSVVGRISEYRSELSSAQSDLNNSIDRKESIKKDLKETEERIDEYEQAIAAATQEYENTNELLRNNMDLRKELNDRIHEQERLYHEFLEKEKTLDSRIDSSKEKLKFLEGLDASYEGYDSGVKFLLENPPEGLKGVVADMIDVDDSAMVEKVEKALGPLIQTLVFSSDQEMFKAAEYLQENSKGQARMISLESMLGDRIPAEGPSSEGVFSLRERVQGNEDTEGLLDLLLRHIYVCEDSGDLLKLRSEYIGRGGFITSEGLFCDVDGSIVAGKSDKEASAAILQRKEEIKRLKKEISERTEERSGVITEKEQSIIARDEAGQSLTELDKKLEGERQKLQEYESRIKYSENSAAELRDKKFRLTEELRSINANIEEYKNKVAENKKGIEELEKKKDELSGILENSREQTIEMEEKRKELSEHLRNVEFAAIGLRNRIEEDKRSIESLNSQISSLINKKETKSGDIKASEDKIRSLETRMQESKESLSSACESRENLEKEYEAKREEYNGLLNQENEIREKARELSSSIEEKTNRKHDLEMKQTREEEKQRRIRENIYENWEVDLEAPGEGVEIPDIDEEDADVSDNIQMLKERLKRIGPVNEGAIQEYEQENTEFKNLSAQRDDLERSVEDLKSAIEKLNVKAKSRFIETFELVQKNFTEMFTTLFNGGEAHLELEDSSDPLNSNIEINVRPAGKKMRGVKLLSGGERALTAIALLFSLYMVKPSAYCVLDELDAPLDDANVDRFLKILNKFIDTTQFIVITHNKHTTEAADSLYGVTQAESGVSSVASLDFKKQQNLEAA